MKIELSFEQLQWLRAHPQFLTAVNRDRCQAILSEIGIEVPANASGLVLKVFKPEPGSLIPEYRPIFSFK